MDEYLKKMENYSPNTLGTGNMIGESEIIKVVGTPQMTAITEDALPADAPYMAPKTIEVRRYTLKK